MWLIARCFFGSIVVFAFFRLLWRSSFGADNGDGDDDGDDGDDDGDNADEDDADDDDDDDGEQQISKYRKLINASLTYTLVANSLSVTKASLLQSTWCKE